MKEDRDREKSTADVVGDQRPANRPTSTTELAKDLEHAEPVGTIHHAATTLFPENEAKDFHTRWMEIEQRLSMSLAVPSSKRIRWLPK